jgi:hypothetical protein
MLPELPVAGPAILAAKGAVSGNEPDEALGRSRGGLITKIHLASEGVLRPLVLVLSAGQVGDATRFTAVLAGIRVPHGCARRQRGAADGRQAHLTRASGQPARVTAGRFAISNLHVGCCAHRVRLHDQVSGRHRDGQFPGVTAGSGWAPGNSRRQDSCRHARAGQLGVTPSTSGRRCGFHRGDVRSSAGVGGWSLRLRPVFTDLAGGSAALSDAGER